jgi:hypothetical protein
MDESAKAQRDREFCRAIETYLSGKVAEGSSIEEAKKMAVDWLTALDAREPWAINLLANEARKSFKIAN